MEDIESRYTPPSGFCPNPHYWHSPDSEATETEITNLVGNLVLAMQPEFVLETGTYHGHTAYQIAYALRMSGHGHLVTIEKDINQYKEAVDYIASMDTESSMALPITMLNMNTMDYVPDHDIDFAFFDSWQEGRAEEFLRFHQMGRLKKDAIVAFHDTAPHHQVYKYVQPLEDAGYLKLIMIHSPRGLTIGQVQ